MGTFELSSDVEVSFESDDNDFEVEIVLESDEEDLNASSIILTSLETTLASDDENVMVVNDFQSSMRRKKAISLAEFNSDDIVFESDEEDQEEDTLLPSLRRVSNDASFSCCDNLSVRDFNQNSKSIYLETTIPQTSEQCPKQQMLFSAKTTGRKCWAMLLSHYM